MEELTLKHLPLLSLLAIAAIAPTTQSRSQYFQFPSLVEAEQAAGQQLYLNHCAACHSPQGVARGLGPSLVGIVGRPAASLPGFHYSDALRKSGLTWTPDNLRKWIANNTAMVPNTLMPHVSVSDPAEQIYLVAYLKTLKPRN